MNKPFITYDDVYLLLKPLTFDIISIIWFVFILFVLIFFYKSFKKNIQPLTYIIISILIIINSTFILYFSRLMPLEAARFINNNTYDSVEIFENKEFKSFLKLLTSEIKPEQKYFFYDPANPYYKNVRVKCRLMYYLAPRRIAEYPEDADYMIIVNYDKPLPPEVKIPENKRGYMKKHNKNLMLIKLMDNNKIGLKE